MLIHSIRAEYGNGTEVTFDAQRNSARQGVGACTRLAGVAVLMVGVSGGCVHRYDTEPLSPTSDEVRVANRFTYSDETPPDKVTLVNAEWMKLGAKCAKVRAAMQRESDGIASKNAVTGALFAAVSAGLAVASGLYTTAKGDDADPTISAGLALGAGATTVPTFFFFGSDEREKIVDSRIEALDAGLEQVQVAWEQFNTADTRLTQNADTKERSQVRYDTLRGDGSCDDIESDTEKRECFDAKARLDEAEEQESKDVAAWHDATNALDRSVQRLLVKCR